VLSPPDLASSMPSWVSPAKPRLLRAVGMKLLSWAIMDFTISGSAPLHALHAARISSSKSFWRASFRGPVP
jgi:hypothetical protein